MQACYIRGVGKNLGSNADNSFIPRLHMEATQTTHFELHTLHNTSPTLTPLQYLNPKSTKEILKLLSRAVI